MRRGAGLLRTRVFCDHHLAKVIQDLVKCLQVSASLERVLDKGIVDLRQDVDEQARGALCDGKVPVVEEAFVEPRSFSAST